LGGFIKTRRGKKEACSSAVKIQERTEKMQRGFFIEEEKESLREEKHASAF